jgi:hypothetical protein
MKTSPVGLVSAAILMVVAGVGFGIAQAGGGPSDNPAWTLQDQEAVEQYQDYLVGPYTEDRPVLSFGDEMQLRNPTDTGNLPTESNADSSIPETEENMHRTGGEDIDGP